MPSTATSARTRRHSPPGRRLRVVDTGPWIFGRKVLLPAGAWSGSTRPTRGSTSTCTKDQYKAAPEYGEEQVGDAAYRDRLGSYYEGTYDDRNPL